MFEIKNFFNIGLPKIPDLGAADDDIRPNYTEEPQILGIGETAEQPLNTDEFTRGEKSEREESAPVLKTPDESRTENTPAGGINETKLTAACENILKAFNIDIYSPKSSNILKGMGFASFEDVQNIKRIDNSIKGKDKTASIAYNDGTSAEFTLHRDNSGFLVKRDAQGNVILKQRLDKNGNITIDNPKKDAAPVTQEEEPAQETIKPDAVKPEEQPASEVTEQAAKNEAAAPDNTPAVNDFRNNKELQIYTGLTMPHLKPENVIESSLTVNNDGAKTAVIKERNGNIHNSPVTTTKITIGTDNMPSETVTRDEKGNTTKETQYEKGVISKNTAFMRDGSMIEESYGNGVLRTRKTTAADGKVKEENFENNRLSNVVIRNTDGTETVLDINRTDTDNNNGSNTHNVFSTAEVRAAADDEISRLKAEREELLQFKQQGYPAEDGGFRAALPDEEYKKTIDEKIQVLDKKIANLELKNEFGAEEIERMQKLGWSIDDIVHMKSLGINGLIDENVKQRSTGDCWLLSGINSLASIPKGQELLSRMIKPADGGVIVKFPYAEGGAAEYFVSDDEILSNNNDGEINKQYSSGDNDMLVLELAVEKHLNLTSGRGLNGGNRTDAIFKILVGSENVKILNTSIFMTKEYEKKIKEWKAENEKQGSNKIDYSQIENFIKSYVSTDDVLTEILNKKDSTACEFGLFSGHEAVTTDNEPFKWNYGGHGFAITDVTADTVTFSNPWDKNKHYTMTWEQFNKLDPNDMAIADLSNIDVRNI